MSDGPTHAPDVEALLLSAAYALAREVTGAEELLAGGAVQRDRLDPGQLARIGEAPDGPPLALTYELARRIEANRETKPLQELVQDSRPTTSPRSREATEEAETPSLARCRPTPRKFSPWPPVRSSRWARRRVFHRRCSAGRRWRRSRPPSGRGRRSRPRRPG